MSASTEKSPATTGKTPATEIKQSTLAASTKALVDSVEISLSQMVKNGKIQLPKSYSVQNALKAAYLTLQTVEDKDKKPALTVCTRESVANALLDMVCQGLNVHKKQGYFIVYGKTLVFQRSYFGAMAVAETVCPKVKDWGYDVVYKGDVFEYGIVNGKKSVKTHVQKLENIVDANILAAYCSALDADGQSIKTEIMTLAEIHQAWKQSKARPFDDNGKLNVNSTHAKFPRDMALRTVINKVAKFIINASTDNELLLSLINKNEDVADAAAVKAEVEMSANASEVLEITAESHDADADNAADAPAEAGAAAACVCAQMEAEKVDEFDCPVHGRRKDGKFTPIPPSGNGEKRKPGFGV